MGLNTRVSLGCLPFVLYCGSCVGITVLAGRVPLPVGPSDQIAVLVLGPPGKDGVPTARIEVQRVEALRRQAPDPQRSFLVPPGQERAIVRQLGKLQGFTAQPAGEGRQRLVVSNPGPSIDEVDLSYYDATATRVVPRCRLHFLPRDLPLIGALWAVPATLLILLVIVLARFVRDRGKPA
jgi:hypothetical protein